MGFRSQSAKDKTIATFGRRARLLARAEAMQSGIGALLVCVDNGCPHEDDCPSGCRAVEECREAIRADNGG